MGLLDFLFGKDPDIFDDKGNVRHKLPDSKWDAWKKRFRTTEYDWRAHTGRTLRKSGSDHVGKTENETPVVKGSR